MATRNSNTWLLLATCIPYSYVMKAMRCWDLVQHWATCSHAHATRMLRQGIITVSSIACGRWR
jgi:hypothetical protein